MGSNRTSLYAPACCRYLLAAQAGFLVRSYEDTAVGVMARNERDVLWVNTVTLEHCLGRALQPRPGGCRFR